MDFQANIWNFKKSLLELKTNQQYHRVVEKLYKV